MDHLIPSDRKEGMRWLLEFIRSPLPKIHSIDERRPAVASLALADIQKGIERFIYAVRPKERFVRRPIDPLTDEAVQKLHSIIRHGVSEIAQGGTWDLLGDQLSGGFGLIVGAGWMIYDGDYRDQFLLTCVDLMRREGNLIAKCAREDCGSLIMRSRRSRYCSKACSRLVEARQARNRRRETSPDEKTRIRRSYYLARLRRQDPAHWRHLSDAAKSVAKAIKGLNKVER